MVLTLVPQANYNRPKPNDGISPHGSPSRLARGRSRKREFFANRYKWNWDASGISVGTFFAAGKCG